MTNSDNWENYAEKNKRLAWGDIKDDDAKWHEQERQRAEDQARTERAWEARQREEDERRR